MLEVEDREQVIGGEGGELGGELPGVWTSCQGTEGICCEESGMSVPGQMAPFGALCHLVSMSEVPSTWNRAFPWRQDFEALAEMPSAGAPPSRSS